MTPLADSLTTKEIARRLAHARQTTEEYPHPYPPGLLYGDPAPAAVLIPFLRHQDTWHILFIRRTNPPQDRHGGQVAFPGGQSDPEDETPRVTALREAQEEIGLQPRDVHILGELPATLTVTNYRVTPVVGTIPWPYPLKIDRAEVERVFTIPLAWLAAPQNHETCQRSMSPYGTFRVTYFLTYDGEVLWGASARIMLHLLEALGFNVGSKPPF